MRLGHISAIIISGAIWLVVGILLATKGVGLIFQCMSATEFNDLPLIKLFIKYSKTVGNAARHLVILSIMIGYFKARFALSKSVARNVKRLLLMQAPIKLTELFSVGYLFIIGFMAILGMVFRFLPIPVDVRALIDISVGIALINGFLIYLKYSVALKRQKAQK